jgi:Transposase DDE domain
MEMQVITVYCICDDLVKFFEIKDDIQVTMSTAEILTTAITAALFFGNNQEQARIFLKEYNYIPNMLSKSQFNRRLHAIPTDFYNTIFSVLANKFKSMNISGEYVVDSFPIEVCKNIRIGKSKIYKKDEKYRGKCVSKREYFYGVRMHMISTIYGEPVEIHIAPGSYHDSRIFKQFDLDLPEGSNLYADSGYTDYEYEDFVNESSGFNFLVMRKSNSKRPHKPWVSALISHFRKTIETTFSKITSLFPKSIHAVTAKGFELKVFLFALAHSFKCL